MLIIITTIINNIISSSSNSVNYIVIMFSKITMVVRKDINENSSVQKCTDIHFQCFTDSKFKLHSHNLTKTSETN